MRDHEDSELEGDDLVDQIIDKGKLVFCHEWDSGAPILGAGCEQIYRWKGRFAVASLDFDNSGPFASLDEALQTQPLLIIGLFDVTSPAPPAAELWSLS